jgi:hypothetical protein
MLNSMRTGRVYNATTLGGDEVIGKYLGYEVVYGEWAILLQDDDADITISLKLDDIDTVLLGPSA